MSTVSLAVTAFAALCLAMTPTLPGQAPDRDAIVDVITDYAQGADERDAERVARALHEHSVQYVVRPDRLLPINREQYLGLLEDGSIGGEERQLTVHSVDIANENAALAKIELAGSLRFTQYVGLVKGEDGWKIVSIVTTLG